MTYRPLPVYPAASEERVAVLREAKAQLDTDQIVVPQNAVQGSPAPVLAMGEHPDYLTDYVYVRPDGAEDPARVGKALEFWLAGGKTHSEADLLSRWLGCDVTFVGVESYTPKVGFQ